MRNTIDSMLDRMDNLLIDMGDLCVNALNEATIALRMRDMNKARAVMNCDDEIDDLESKIDSICLSILLREQPFARDLRRVIAATKMVTDLERIGDQAADIADIVLMSEVEFHDEAKLIETMAEKTCEMVSNSIRAFVSRDLELTRKIIEADDEVDALFERMIGVLKDNGSLDYDEQKAAIDMMMISKYLERIGDHATNVAEWVEFSITGMHPSYEG